MLLFGCHSGSKKQTADFNPAYAKEQSKKAWEETLPDLLKQIVPPTFKDTIYLVSDTLNFQQTLNTVIAEASAKGGGMVRIHPNTYQVAGPIQMKSNINLQIPEGTLLLFSTDPKAYLPLVKVRWEGTFCLNYSPLIYAEGEENLAITGKGVIDGRAALFFHQWKQLQEPDKQLLRKMGNDQLPLEERVFGEGHHLRPSGIEFLECKNILFEDFTIKGSPFWTLHPVLSENISCRNLTILAGTTNDDGIDPDSCKNVLIENNTIHTHDDCVAIKAGRDQDGWAHPGTENIVVRNNTLKTEVGSGFCIGSEMSGGVENIFAENNKINSNKHAFNFKSNPDRGGHMKQLYLRNMQVDSALYGLAFTTDYKGWRGNDHPTKYSDFFMEDIHINYTAYTPIGIVGLQREPIRRVYLKNVTVKTTDSVFQQEHVKDLLLEDVKIDGLPVATFD